MASYTISAPNGKSYTIDGPAGASQEDVQNEVLRQYPTAGQMGAGEAKPTTPAVSPPSPVEPTVVNRGEPVDRSLGVKTARIGGITAKGLVAGALAAPGELAVLGAKGLNWLGDKVTGNSKPNEFLNGLDVTGTINQLLPGDVAPENLPERMAKTGAEMAGGMVSTGGVGGMKGAGLLSKAGAAQIARAGVVGGVSKGAGEAVGVINPTAGAVVEVLGNIIGGPRSAQKISQRPQLTSDDRFKEANTLYEKSKQSGVVITGKATSTMVDELRQHIGDPDLTANKEALKAVAYLSKHSGNGKTGWIGIDLDKLMKVRKDMRVEAVGGGISQSKESKRAGYKMLERFDELVETMGVDQLHKNSTAVRGPNGKFLPAGTDELAKFKEGMAFKQAADAAYRQASKAKIVEDMLLKAETLQGGTLAERYRAKMGQLIRSEPKFKQFSPEEQDLIRAYHKGTKTQEVTEAIAKLSPARGGILPTLGAAMAVGTGGMSLPLQAAGGLAHYYSGPQSKAAQYGMMQTILGGQQAPTQAIGTLLPSKDALRAGMLSGAPK